MFRSLRLDAVLTLIATPPTSLRRDVKCRHLVAIPHEQTPPGNRRIVPGLSFDRLEAGSFGKLIGSGAHQGKLARIGNHDQVTAGENQLTIAVTPPFPLALARIDIEAGQNSLVQTVNVALMKNRAVELVLHVDIFPNRAGAAAFDFDQRRPFTIPRRDKEPIGTND